MASIRAYWPKVVSGLALAAVAGVAGVISYTHIYRLTLALHQPVMVAKLMPIAVDGLVVVGSVVLLESAPGQRRLGWVGVGPGVAISVFANVESGIGYGVLAAAWAGIPAVAFALATFMLERWAKAQVSGDVKADIHGQAEAVPDVPEAVPEPHLNGSGLHPAEAEPFADDLAQGKVPGIRRIRDELHVGQPKAQEIQARLAVLARTP
jgi:hypothetical protein